MIGIKATATRVIMRDIADVFDYITSPDNPDWKDLHLEEPLDSDFVSVTTHEAWGVAASVRISVVGFERPYELRLRGEGEAGQRRPPPPQEFGYSLRTAPGGATVSYFVKLGVRSPLLAPFWPLLWIVLKRSAGRRLRLLEEELKVYAIA